MEEKERYSYDYFIDGAVFIDTENDRDMDMDTVCSLLNKQDKRIKELEETNKILSNELTKNSILKQDHIETCCGIPIFEIPKMKEENEELKLQLETFAHRISDQNKEILELKQQLYDLPKKIVEDITNELSNNTSLYFEMRESTSAHCPNKEYEWFNYVRFRNYINAILKKYGGEDE